MRNLKNTSPRILVVGDLIIDRYLWGESDNISPEAPVPVVNIFNQTTLLGGAGNVINNLKTLGANADIISVIGNYETCIEAKELFKINKINTKYLIQENKKKTSKKTRVISSKQQVVRYDQESTKNISKSSQIQIIDLFSEIINQYSCVLFSDYGKGIFSEDLTQKLIKISNQNKVNVLIDPKGSNFSKYKGAFLLTPNKSEAINATNIQINSDKDLYRAIIFLLDQFKLDISLITLSDKGIAVFDGEFRIHPTVAREVFDVTGAGDTVLASLGFALANNLNIDDAIEFSNLAAGVVVGKVGSATASINEIIDYESSLNKLSSEKHIKSIEEIKTLTKDYKAQGKKIIFTNGCFDLLHYGHIRYLEASKNLGDILIIGLNSDKSIKKIKGNDRPINSEGDRAYLIAALESVDFVVIFDEETPLELIKLIAPDILVKGGDYKDKKVVGQEIVDELRIIDFVPGKSTSNIINKIKNLN